MKQTKEDNSFPKIKIQETWSFKSDYTGPKDPKIEKDIEAIENTYADFAKKYSSQEEVKKYMSDANNLLQALNDWNILLEKTGTAKPLWYLHLITDINSEDTKTKAIYNKLEQRVIAASNAILFFNLNLAKITPENQIKFLKDPMLSKYRAYLSSIFEIAKYNLPEGEEKILSLKSVPAYSMWVDAQKKLLTSQTVKHKGKQIPITEAQAIKSNLPQKERHALHKELVETYKRISFFAEAEINAVVSDKRINDDLRGFTKPYEATVLGYQNSIKSVESLVSAVTSRFKDSEKFFKLKAKVLGLDKLTSADIGVPMSKSKTKYSLPEGIGIVYEAFRAIKPEFADMFAKFVSEGRFDFYPRKGKRNGAYCSGGVGVDTHILLNHVDDFNSISTIAHEMGHAIHFELSKKQSAIYEDFSISIAEVASTFFENVLFDYVYNRASDTEKKVMLLEKIQDNITTIHAQIAYFNFEKALHEDIRSKGSISAAEISSLLVKHRRNMFGKGVLMTEDDGYSFIAVPHFRYFFYVYSYAYGQLIANALYAEYKVNPEFLEKIEYFLSAGSSAKPDEVFKNIGIDVTDPNFFEKGLDEIAQRIKEAEKLISKTVNK